MSADEEMQELVRFDPPSQLELRSGAIEPCILALTLAPYTTPSQLLNLFDLKTVDKWHWAEIMKLSFESLLPVLRKMITQRPSAKVVQRYFESELVQHGYLPCTIQPNHVSDGRYGYNTKDGYREWNIVNVKWLRAYWDTIFQSSNSEVQHVCQLIISLLPPSLKFKTCACCGWSIPDESMYSSDQCEYCYELKRVSVQQMFRVYENKKSGERHVCIYGTSVGRA